jgi:hypothetical protein
VLDTSIGLQSLHFAELIVRVHRDLTLDPFAENEVLSFLEADLAHI